MLRPRGHKLVSIHNFMTRFLCECVFLYPPERHQPCRSDLRVSQVNVVHPISFHCMCPTTSSRQKTSFAIREKKTFLTMYDSTVRHTFRASHFVCAYKCAPSLPTHTHQMCVYVCVSMSYSYGKLYYRITRHALAQRERERDSFVNNWWFSLQKPRTQNHPPACFMWKSASTSSSHFCCCRMFMYRTHYTRSTLL